MKYVLVSDQTRECAVPNYFEGVKPIGGFMIKSFTREKKDAIVYSSKAAAERAAKSVGHCIVESL